jgi:proteasome lid subunit RPN8/RPN11
VIDEMIAHARDDLPNEACGVIYRTSEGALELARLRNKAASPYRYEIDPDDLVQIDRRVRGTDEIFAIYHSHVATEAYPSPTDVRGAFWTGKYNDETLRLHPDAYYVLVSLADLERPVVRAFRIHAAAEIADAIGEEPIEVNEEP